MAYAIDDPLFSAPAYDPLNPVTTWAEVPEECATVKLALIVAKCPPLANERVIRIEVLSSPHYFRVHWGQMLKPSQAIDVVVAGFDVEISRFVVLAGLLDVVPQLAEELAAES